MEHRPPGWGRDKLSAYLEDANGNRFATFFNKRQEYALLSEIDDCFTRIGENLINPKGLIEALLLLRSHSAFRTACGCAMAGQATDTYPLIRTTLEYAGYALFVQGDHKAQELWLRRHEGAGALAAVRKHFQSGSIVREIKKKDKELGHIYEGLYNVTIDFGAHPNERSVTGSLAILKGEEKTTFQQIFLHGDDLAAANALVSVARAGLCALYLFANVFSERFQLLGLIDRMDALRKVL